MSKFDSAIDELCRHVVTLKSIGNPELAWLKRELVEMLQETGNRSDLRLDYEQECEDKILNPWLREMTNRYFN